MTQQLPTKENKQKRIETAQKFIEAVAKILLPKGCTLTLDDWGDYSFGAVLILPVVGKGFRGSYLNPDINLRRITATFKEVKKDFPDIINLNVTHPERIYRNIGTNRSPDLVFDGYDRYYSKINFEIHKP